MALNNTLLARIDPDTAPPVALRPRGKPMPYKLTIELSDRDLRHFRRELKKARASVQIADDEEILGAALDMVKVMQGTDLPDFVTERLEQLESLIAMVTDEDWPLADDERNPVLSGLAYLCDPEDLIPDNIPGIGMLDDAEKATSPARAGKARAAAYRTEPGSRLMVPVRSCRNG